MSGFEVLDWCVKIHFKQEEVKTRKKSFWIPKKMSILYASYYSFIFIDQTEVPNLEASLWKKFSLKKVKISLKFLDSELPEF